MPRGIVIIPVHNEEATIEAVLGELCRHYDGDVLIVDDGSTDRSIERIHCCIQKRVTLLQHKTNQGYGQSLIDGFSYAIEKGYEIAVTMDCDFQHEPKQVPEFFNRIDADTDILSGSRYLDTLEKDVSAPADRKQINQLITTEINSLTGFAITDAFCGFKAYRVAGLRKLSLNETGYAFPLQFWLQAKAAGLRVKEIAVPRIYTDAKRSFGANLDDPERRLKHYRDTIEREAKIWKLM